jgi:hypothetical protein
MGKLFIGPVFGGVPSPQKIPAERLIEERRGKINRIIELKSTNNAPVFHPSTEKEKGERFWGGISVKP